MADTPPDFPRDLAAKGQWSDEHLAHMCRMSTAVVAMIRAEDFDPRDIGDEPLQNVKNMYRILAATFVELQARAGMKPKFTATVIRPARDGRYLDGVLHDEYPEAIHG